jgi:hypothetical protein
MNFTEILTLTLDLDLHPDLSPFMLFVLYHDPYPDSDVTLTRTQIPTPTQAQILTLTHEPDSYPI